MNKDGCNKLKYEYNILKYIYNNGSYLVPKKFDLQRFNTIYDLTMNDNSHINY